MSDIHQLPEVALLAQGFAMCAHRNQRRKYEDVPYMVHPIRVARIVHEYTDDANVIAAAMMHDVLEDTDVTAEEMRRVFGDPMTDLVLEVTDVSRPSDGKSAVRKEKDKEHLAKSSPGGAIIKLADLIDNCVSITAHDKGFAPIYLRGPMRFCRLLSPLSLAAQTQRHRAKRASPVRQTALGLWRLCRGEPDRPEDQFKIVARSGNS